MMSMYSGEALPATQVPANQYLNLMDMKFSKSSGVSLDAAKAVKDFWL